MSEVRVEMNSSLEIGEIVKALAKVQENSMEAELNCENEHLKSKYADLGSVSRACRPFLAANGIAVTQVPQRTAQNTWELVTTLWHTSGQWMRATLPLILQKNDMQGLGSALSYARRYSLGAMVGVTQEDDDGERSIDREKRQANNRQQSAPPQGNQRPPAQSAQNEQKAKLPTPKAAQNVQKQPAPTFADSPPPSLKRPRGTIAAEVMKVAKELGIGQDLTPPDEMQGLENISLELFKCELVKTTDDQLEKMLEKLNEKRMVK